MHVHKKLSPQVQGQDIQCDGDENDKGDLLKANGFVSGGSSLHANINVAGHHKQKKMNHSLVEASSFRRAEDLTTKRQDSKVENQHAYCSLEGCGDLK
jgi:hypothetical protein